MANPTTVQMNGADIIVDFLIRQNVPYLFGLCGHGNVGFLDAAFKAQNRIRTISVHHEQAAGHMADAYFKVRHEPVATFTSCGPGSANLVVALAAAMMDSSAFFAITGNVPTSQFNRQPFQETGRYYQGDFPSVIRPYVKRSFQPTRTDMVPLAVRQAWDLMLAGRPGPVNLDVPLNVFVEEAAVTPPPPAAAPRTPRPAIPRRCPPRWICCSAAERPVIIAGQGVLLAGGGAGTRRLRRGDGDPGGHQPERQGMRSPTVIRWRLARSAATAATPPTTRRSMPTSSCRWGSRSTTAPPAPGWTAIRWRSRPPG